MKHFALMSLALVSVIILSPLAGFADPPSHAKGHQHADKSYGYEKSKKWDNDHDHDKDWNDKKWNKNASRNNLDQYLFRQFISSRSPNLDPRTRSLLMQQKPLPPGIRKNLMRGKPLPPGIAKQVYNLPPSAYSYLGISPNQYRLGSVGRNVVMYDIASGIVRDILFNAF